MKKLTDLFTLMELTRSMPQYGYILSGVKRDDLSNLAEHHYLVTFIAWQIALHLKSKGAKLNVGKVMEFAMVHDLGELFGGDISMPYAKVNPKAREYAKMFEEENQRFFAKFFGEQEDHFKNLGHEILDAVSDEALVAKFSDYIEHAHFKNFLKL
jgi:5'-deoxynucleotidase YfbR-like HD superfamily hydrolase